MIKAVAITLLLLGDLNFTGTQYLEAFSRSGYDPAFSFSATAPVIRQADIAIANLEGPLTFADWSESGRAKDWPFRQLPIFAQGINAAGVDVLLLGNNHIGDAGTQGITDTLRVLKKNGILWAPPPQDGPLIIERQGHVIEIWNADVFSPPASTPWAISSADLVRLVRERYAASESPALSLAVLHYHYSGKDSLLEKEDLAAQLREVGVQWVVFGGDHQPANMYYNASGGVHYGLGDFIFGCECSGATKGKALSLSLAPGFSEGQEVPVSLGTPKNGFVSHFDAP